MPDHPPITPLDEPLPSPDEIVGVGIMTREYDPDDLPDFKDGEIDDEEDE